MDSLPRASAEILPRPVYLDKLRPYFDVNVVKVLVGQRRVGKSYILMAVAEEIKQRNPEGNIIEINLENFAFSHTQSASDLYSEISSRLQPDKKNYIFIDEVQEVKDFDKVVRSLILDPRNDVYLTGSNSSMLSSEIASRLAGRSIVVHVHPLTYKEFQVFHALSDSDETLETFLRYGGLPYLINLPKESTWGEYLSGITDAIVYRDVVARHTLRNTDFLGRLLLFLADNIGSLFNAKRIADYLKAQHVTSSISGVQTYLGYLAEAYIINRSRRWSIAGKKYFEIGEKYFFEDLGIRNSIVGYRLGDIGGLLENAVYNHLIAAGYTVKVGVLSQDKEIDFIAERDNELRYVQVALALTEEKTMEREFGNLARIPDNYEKMVVTFRDTAPNTYKGILLMSLREFLMS